MANTMSFPQTIEEFMEQYKVVDTEQVYSNGVEFVPIFRIKQWLEHQPDPKEIFYDGYAYCLVDFGKDTVLCKDCKHFNDGDCTEMPKICSESDYCSWGERKDGGEND